jgi:dTDP-glucose 4,6-dehydratase
MNVLVTGARGFIGSHLVKHLLKEGMFNSVSAFVRDTNSWTKKRLPCEHSKLKIIKGDLNGDISGLCEGIDVVYNLAAKTFVDHSIRDPKPFIESNVIGTANLLEESKRQGVQAFFQISTDEVYGEILKGVHTEESPLCPRNPYAASKAGADALVISYTHTFGMWTCVTRTENNYGGWQHPQKVMPNFINRALNDKELPVYGDGQHVRQWLHVEDHVRALVMLYEEGFLKRNTIVNPGEVFHVAGNQELTNLELSKKLLHHLGKSEDLIKFIDDYNIRPGHDRRYALSCDKIKRAIGWVPEIGLDQGIQNTINWYKDNPDWLN